VQLSVERRDRPPICLRFAVESGDRSLELVRPRSAKADRGVEHASSFRDPVGIPERAILVLEEDEVTVGVEPRRPAGVVEKHERDQPERVRLVGHQRGQDLRQSNRLVEELVPRRWPVAGVEDEVEHGEDGAQAIGQQVVGRHAEGDARVADLPLRANEPLRHRRLGDEECSRDLLGREAADRPQRERHLRLGRKRGMTAGEDEAQAVVRNRAHLLVLSRPLLQERELAVERSLAADPVEGPVARCGQKPGRRVVRHPVARPPLQRGCERILKRVLGEVEVAEGADQGREDAAALLAEEAVSVGLAQ
jgi:hypothetical protein